MASLKNGSMAPLLLVVICLFASHARAAPAGAEIKSLPGMTFTPPFKQYSGYLNASSDHYQHYFFYWLVESQGKPSDDPLVLWLNGGPGCSSLNGFLAENGPFRNSYGGGNTLYENRFAWNKAANFLFMESPTGIGFSYAVDGDDRTSDDQTARDNYQALVDFFKQYPEYQKRDFYISGESYGGVYLPMLAELLIKGKQSGQFKGNLKGMAIGNGLLSLKEQANSAIDLLYYRGVIGFDVWDDITAACCAGVPHDGECNYWAHLKPTRGDNIVSDGTKCGNLSSYVANTMIANGVNDAQNGYRKCYNFKSKKTRMSLALGNYFPKDVQAPGDKDGVMDTARLINTGSSDNMAGFPCWSDDSLIPYLNRKDVQRAIHIKEDRIGQKWQECNGTIGSKLYNTTHLEMHPEFDYLLSESNISILVYNGDIDYVCNFLGDELFIKNVSVRNKLKSSPRHRWTYGDQVAGFVQNFGGRIDLLTVQGAGHMVPLDRAGPALQMITNFIRQSGDYNKSVPFNMDLQPLLMENGSGSSEIYTLRIALLCVVMALVK